MSSRCPPKCKPKCPPKPCPSPCDKDVIFISTRDDPTGPRVTGPWAVADGQEVSFIAGEGLEVASNSSGGVTTVTYSEAPNNVPAFSTQIDAVTLPVDANGPITGSWQDTVVLGEGVSSNSMGAVTIPTGIWEFSLTFTEQGMDANLGTTTSGGPNIGLNVSTTGMLPEVILIGSFIMHTNVANPMQYRLDHTGTITATSDAVQIDTPVTLQVNSHSNFATGNPITLGIAAVDPAPAVPAIVFSGHKVRDLPALPIV